MSQMKSDFSGAFGDFYTMFHDTDIAGYNVFTWRDNPSTTYATVMRIVGFTPLQRDYLLHTVYVPDAQLSADTEDLIEEFGISFISLSQLLGDWGFTIRPIPEE